MCHLLWILLIFITSKIQYSSTCVPNRAGAFYYSYSSSYFAWLQNGQCARYGFPDSYCSSLTTACHVKCSTDNDCIVTRSDGTTLQQHCQQITETAAGLGITPGSVTTTNVCVCKTSAECQNGETCRNGACICYQDGDCGIGQKCYFFGISYDQYYKFGINGVSRSFGECQADLASNVACNSRGKPNGKFYQSPPNDAAPIALSVPGGSLQTQGYCRCYSGYAGKSCELDQAPQLQCSGRGDPLCTRAVKSGASLISLNSGSSLGANFCNLIVMDQIGEVRGANVCRCQAGWGPENSAPGGVAKCSIPIPCTVNLKAAGQLAVDGTCRCFGDNYDLLDSTTPSVGACLANCKNLRCLAHGTCTSNPLTSDSFNSQCKCDNGWRTSKNQVRINAATSKFASQTYCDIPYDQSSGKTCGYWADEIAAPFGQNCKISAAFSSKSSVLIMDSVSSLYVQFCPYSSNPLFSTQICSGSDHGVCGDDGHFGYHCICQNGYTGLDCSTLIGPSELYNNGAKCSGNGLIANPTLNTGTFDVNQGVCICNENYYGTSCEKQIQDCNYGAPINSYPLNKNIPSIIS